MNKSYNLTLLAELPALGPNTHWFYMSDGIDGLQKAHPHHDIDSFLLGKGPLGTSQSFFSILLSLGHLISMDDEDPEGNHCLHQAITEDAVDTLNRILHSNY
ncbi:hypothetical protein [Rufibacter tibetensis]|uniref:Uncharacterized protein n=1 Tax=Rufibacter tibetensis TaxID=512763 RepID=A0A0N7HW88_9BACT|nr:hypothetical protein [Rufibacter tibetensis]ALI98568.1 hypothetical protein DC20_05780 [Rufibacter tibetensis]